MNISDYFMFNKDPDDFKYDCNWSYWLNKVDFLGNIYSFLNVLTSDLELSNIYRKYLSIMKSKA
jgi:hypothetical protein